MKKAALILAVLLTLSGISANASDKKSESAPTYINDKGDKYISITRNENWKTDEITTFIVANVSGMKNSGEDVTWREIADLATSSADTSDIIEYYNSGTVAAVKKVSDGVCEFNFTLSKSGVYKCFLADQSGNTDIFYINHIDKESQKAAADSVIAACVKDRTAAVGDIKNILNDKTYDFGFRDDLYANVVSGTNNNADNAAGYIYDYVNGGFDKNANDYADTLCGVILRAFAAESLNMGITENLYDIEYAMGMDSLGLDEYAKREHADILNNKMKARKYASVEEYDKALTETFTGLVIQYNDGSGEIPSVLKKFAALSGIDTNKITTAFCNSIAGSDKYYNFDVLKEYARNYVEPSPDSGKGSGGSSGGSSGSGGGKFSPITADNDVLDKNDTSSSANIFDDVKKEHWANQYIETLYKEGTVSGVNATEYKPEDNITREEFVKLIVSALKLNTIGSSAPFVDVDKDAWYSKYVNIAYNAKIINGISETEFGTGINISRQDIAVIVANALNALDYNFADGGDLTFGDSDAIDTYAKEAVRLLKNSGILNGDENNMFNPQNNATRAEAAKIIYMISR